MAQGHDDLYSEIKPRLVDALSIASATSNIADVPLDLLNRAQRSLSEESFWQDLLVEASLTVAADRTAPLPSAYAKMLAIWWDSNSDGKPDYYFYRDGDIQNGFSIRSIFVKATGHAYTATFFNAPQFTPKILYQKTLPAFVGTGTEYSFFPGELLIREAMKIHYTDAGGSKLQHLEAIKAERDQLLKDFKQGHQWLNSPQEQKIKDQWGNEVFMPVADLSGVMDFAPRSRTQPPSYDNG